MKFVYDLGIASMVGLFVVLVVWYSLSRNLLIGPIILLIGIIPMFSGKIRGIEIKRMVPDMIFGTIDTGLLVIAALIGAKHFGVIGAVVGGSVGDALTDGIAGFFEGGIAEFLRKHGIEEARTAISSSMGKMAGCLYGSGFVLTIVSILS